MKLIRNAVAVGVFLIVCNSTVLADNHEWNASFTQGVYSDYMFRGSNLYDGVSLQPSLEIGYNIASDWSVFSSVWSHLSGEGAQGASDKFTEVDYTAGVSYDLDPATLSAGAIWYTFPDDDSGLEATGEFFGTVAFDFTLNPTVEFYHDYDEFECQYYALGFSEELTSSAMGNGFNITPYVVAGFASNAERVYADDGLVHVTFGLSSALALGKIDVTPSFQYTAESDDNTENEFWFGVDLGYSF